MIGVTGPDRGGFPAWVFAAWAVRRAGGKPVRIRPGKQHEDVPLDGLVIGGGADVGGSDLEGDEEADPSLAPTAAERAELESREEARSGSRWRALAGLALSPAIWLLRRLFSMPRHTGDDPARDTMELALLRAAERRGVPVLGICRGAQLMNVVAGGSLHRNLAAFYREAPNPWTVLPRKEVTISPDSCVSQVMGDRCLVNSLHRHAINELGAALQVTARDFAGVVQAIEHESREFWLGVQWHPEYMPQRQDQTALFGKLVQAARQPGLLPVRAGQDFLGDLAVAQKERERIHQPQNG